MSSRIPGSTEPRGDTQERRSAQGPALLRDIRDVHRTALENFRGDVSLREILDFTRWHKSGASTRSPVRTARRASVDGTPSRFATFVKMWNFVTFSSSSFDKRWSCSCRPERAFNLDTLRNCLFPSKDGKLCTEGDQVDLIVKVSSIPTNVLFFNFFLWSKVILPVGETKMSFSDMTVSTWTPS